MYSLVSEKNIFSKTNMLYFLLCLDYKITHKIKIKLKLYSETLNLKLIF